MALYLDAELYLSLTRKTDAAFREFFEYFANIDDDVIIVVFGDHQPRLSNAFYEALNGGAIDSLDEIQKQYMVPFI